MDTKEIRIESTADIVQNESADDKRLNAIKKILVGNQIERIENRFRGLSRRVESSNSHLVSIIEELNQEMASIKLRNNSSAPTNSSLNPEVEKLIQEFVDAKKEGKLAEAELVSNLESRLNQVELNINDKVDGSANALKAEVSSFKEKITASQNAFSSKIENRLGELEDSVSAHDQVKASNRLSNLEAEIKSLRSQGSARNAEFETKISERQNNFENDVQDLLERLTGRVNERFDYAADDRKKLTEQFNGLQKVLENDVVSFMRESISNSSKIENRLSQAEEQLNSGVKADQVKMLFESLNSKLNDVELSLNDKIKNNQGDPAAMKEITDRLDRKIYENNIRMEAKLDAMYDLTQRQLANRSEDNSKKEALRETLKKLSQLLDE
tara:strand:+ start:18703 stop:19854 length:1152 start_codon:yes stop_codon:yes gene_type:complete